MDEASFMDWILCIWALWTETVGKPTLLILDEAKSHMTGERLTATEHNGHQGRVHPRETHKQIAANGCRNE